MKPKPKQIMPVTITIDEPESTSKGKVTLPTKLMVLSPALGDRRVDLATVQPIVITAANYANLGGQKVSLNPFSTTFQNPIDGEMVQMTVDLLELDRSPEHWPMLFTQKIKALRVLNALILALTDTLNDNDKLAALEQRLLSTQANRLA